MPFRPRDVFIGKIAPYMVIAALDMVIVVGAGMLLFDVPFRGSVAVFALGAALFLFVTLGTGVLISTVSQTQGQAIQLAMMTPASPVPSQRPVLPPLRDALGRALDRLPSAADLLHQGGARSDGARRAPLDALWIPLVVLAVMAAAVFTASTLRFRRDLAPAGGGDDVSEAADGGDGVDGTLGPPAGPLPASLTPSRRSRCHRRGRLDERLAPVGGSSERGSAHRPHGSVRPAHRAGRREPGRAGRGGHRRDRRRRRRQDDAAPRPGRRRPTHGRHGAQPGAPPDRLRRRRLRSLRRPQRRRERRLRRRGLRRARGGARGAPRRAPRAHWASTASAIASPAASPAACARSWPLPWRCCTSRSC